MSSQKSRVASEKALSVDHGRLLGWGAWFLYGFFALFGIAGMGMLYVMTVKPLWGVFDARGWAETPCTIVSSAVETHRGDDSDTYSIEIDYDYTFGGRPYRGDRYHFMDMASSGRAGKRAVVDAHPVGRQTVCYVDPNEPSEAVIERGLTTDMWWGVFPVPFLAVGFGLPLLMVRGARKKAKNSGNVAGTRSTNVIAGEQSLLDHASDGPLTLKPESSPRTVFVIAVIFSLLWNGAVSFMVRQVIDGFRKGDPEWFLTFFSIPFVLVGIGIIVWAGYAFMALFNPRPTLTLSRGRIPLGGVAHIGWSFAGNSHAIRHLKVSLKGVEQASYHRGTDTNTDEETFYEQVLFESDQSYEIASGEVDIEVPGDAMHTFEADNNEIVWFLHVTGDIPLRPDVDAKFPLVVTPHEKEGR